MWHVEPGADDPPEAISMTMPPLCRWSRQPSNVSLMATAVAKAGTPSRTATPFRWQVFRGHRLMKSGFQNG